MTCEKGWLRNRGPGLMGNILLKWAKAFRSPGSTHAKSGRKMSHRAPAIRRLQALRRAKARRLSHQPMSTDNVITEADLGIDIHNDELLLGTNSD